MCSFRSLKIIPSSTASHPLITKCILLSGAVASRRTREHSSVRYVVHAPASAVPVGTILSDKPSRSYSEAKAHVSRRGYECASWHAGMLARLVHLRGRRSFECGIRPGPSSGIPSGGVF